VKSALVTLVLLAACGGDDGTPMADAAPDPRVVYVVRHAETGSTATDPPLNSTGQARAAALATMIGDKGIELVIASQYMRTQMTAMPTATAAGITVTVHAVNGASYGMELATQVRTTMPHAALIVGHSNTVPDTVLALTGTPVTAINETEYDRLYTITLTETGGTAVETRY